MRIPEHCIQTTHVSKILLEDELSKGKGRSKSKIYFLNPNKHSFLKVMIDNCTIKEGAKCDWLLMNEAKSDQWFVELKDTNISDSIKQLETTLKQLSQSYPSKSKKALIVSTKVPAGARTDLQKAKERFLNQLKTPLQTARSGEEIPLY